MATYDAQIRISVKNLNQLTKLEERVNRVQNALQGKSPTGKQAKANIVATSPELQKEKLITKELKKQLKIRKKMKKTPGGGGGIGRGGKGGALSGALVSGAFPLLFGQGPVGALAGFGGGFIGGKVGGQMGGFAGGLIATAALTQIQQAIDGVTQLGQAMNPLTMDLQKLTQAMGMAGTPAEKYLQVLEQTQGKQAAFNESMKRMRGIIGEEGVRELQKFGETMRALTNNLAEFFTKLSAGFAKVFNRFAPDPNSAIGRANILSRAEKSTDTQIQDLIKERDTMLTGRSDDRRTRRSSDFKNIQNQIIELQKANEATQKLLDTENARALTLGNSIKGITDQNKFLQDQLTLGEQGARIEQAKLKFAKDQKIAISDINAEEVERIKNAVKLNDELKKQKQTQEQIQNILAGGMTNAVMGLIDGTRTLGSVLADVAKQLASMFLNKAFTSFFSKMFSGGISGGGTDFVGLSSAYPNAFDQTFNLSPTLGFAKGGYVSGPTMGLVGEAGESEYIIPASKMSGAMSRYSAGARGGAVIPGVSGNSGTVAGSSGNTVVEYTGPTLNFNGDEYVPKSAVPDIIGAASKQGAMAGKAQVLGSLRNSRSQRASLGL